MQAKVSGLFDLSGRRCASGRSRQASQAILRRRGETLETETLVAAGRPLAMDCAELGMMPILVL
jgi:hypothetical protein